MRLALSFLSFFCSGISLISCSETNSDKNQSDKKNEHFIDTSSVAIISFDKKGNWPFDNKYRPANLSQHDLLEVDSLFRQCALNYNETLPENLKESYGIDFKKYDYKRQYVAVLNNRGEKEVWVNCFCNTWDSRWKKELFLVEDGGNCFFNLKINLTTKKCFDVSVNGYA